MSISVRKLLQDPMLDLRVAAGAAGLDRPITGGRLQAARCNTALSGAGRVGPHFFVGVSSVLPSGSWLSR